MSEKLTPQQRQTAEALSVDFADAPEEWAYRFVAQGAALSQAQADVEALLAVKDSAKKLYELLRPGQEWPIELYDLHEALDNLPNHLRGAD